MEFPPCFSASVAVGIESCRKPLVAEYIRMRAVAICATAYAMHAPKTTKLSIMNKIFGAKPLVKTCCGRVPFLGTHLSCGGIICSWVLVVDKVRLLVYGIRILR